MNLPSPHDDYYGYQPLPSWQGAIRYYGALTNRPGWAHLRPLFDLLKQLATTCFAVTFQPSIVDDALYLSRGPLGAEPVRQPRVRIDANEQHEVTFQLFTAMSESPQTKTVHRADALDMLGAMLAKL